MFDVLLKYNKVYQSELDLVNYIGLGILKVEVDKLLDVKGKWVCTEYLPIGKCPDTIKCYIWFLKYHSITCVFRNDKLISKKIKRRK